jgi:hypothetical protein
MAFGTLTLERCRFGAGKPGFSRRIWMTRKPLAAIGALLPAMEGGHLMAQAFCNDVASLARIILRRSKIFDLRTLEVEQEAECVVLRGSVDSFYHKQLAQEMIKTSLDGVEVINEIRVVYRRAHVDDSQPTW